MCRRIFCLSLALIYTFTIACSDVHHVVRNEIKPEKDHIIDVVTTSGKIVTFDKHGGKLYSEQGAVMGTRRDDGYHVSVPFDSVVSARVRRGDAGETVFAVFGIAFLVVGVLFAIAVATKESCPFVYSFDGSHYVFDAEPLGGAVSKGLERADLSRLEHLRAVDGTYRLLMRNEVEETQYLNEMRLLVVDHPAGTDVHGDLNGTMHVVDDPVAPVTAVNEDGVDLRPMLAAPDDILWQTNLQAVQAGDETALRHTYTFQFKKPAGARDGFLIVKAGTALWGSHMIREMLQMRGDGLDDWYRSIDAGGSAMQELTDFNVREELFFLKLYVMEDGQWVQRAWIPAGGPLHTESRIIPLDLSGVQGDDVQLRVHPPKGFWTFDYLAMEFDHHPAPAVTPVPLARAVDKSRGDVTASLSARDDVRYEMPLVGDSAVLEYQAPPLPKNGARTVFLDTHGYYLLHLDHTQPERRELIADMLAHPGKIVRYSLDRYVEYRDRSMSRN